MAKAVLWCLKSQKYSLGWSLTHAISAFKLCSVTALFQFVWHVFVDKHQILTRLWCPVCDSSWKTTWLKWYKWKRNFEYRNILIIHFLTCSILRLFIFLFAGLNGAMSNISVGYGDEPASRQLPSDDDFHCFILEEMSRHCENSRKRSSSSEKIVDSPSRKRSRLLWSSFLWTAVLPDFLTFQCK